VDNSQRQANLTDALRFVGALCVVWYHNPVYWNLQEYTFIVDSAKLLILGWSMPFFYATSARFTCAGQSFEKISARLGRILILIIIYTVLYEGLHWSSGTGLISLCISRVGECNAALVLDTFRNVGNTPGYYLSDLASMTFLALIACLHPVGKWLLITFTWAAFLLGDSRMSGYFLNPLANACMALALLYSFMIALRPLDSRRPYLPFSIIMLLLLILSWGWANLEFARNEYWNESPRIMLFGGLLLLFMSADDLFEVKGDCIVYLSAWGRNYAFGIFIFHQLCFDILTPHSIRVLRGLLNIADPLVIYLVTGIITTFAALLITKAVRQYAPRLLM
jgi:hypothetical protein